MSCSRAVAAAAVASAAALGGTAAAGRTAAPVPTGKLVGQLIMTAFAGRAPSAGLLASIRAGRVGGVILFGANVGTPAEVRKLTAALQAAAAAGGNPPLLVAVDQEGGAVKRLPAGPPDLSPAAMGRDGRAARARAEGAATAAYLRRLGIDVDLAPVLDTPVSASSWLGSRAFSRNPAVNARLGAAFVRGLQGGGVAATAKHFPGLGTARASTDTSDVVLTTGRAALTARLGPFEAAIGAGVDLVMVSNAGYAAFDPSRTPAVLSPAIATLLLRGELGFRGVVISDALEAPGPRRRGDEAVAAVRAGVDVLLYTSEADADAAFGDLVSAGRDGTFATTLQAAAARVKALKAGLGRR